MAWGGGFRFQGVHILVRGHILVGEHILVREHILFNATQRNCSVAAFIGPRVCGERERERAIGPYVSRERDASGQITACVSHWSMCMCV
jgi:hypothetical protein